MVPRLDTGGASRLDGHASRNPERRENRAAGVKRSSRHVGILHGRDMLETAVNRASQDSVFASPRASNFRRLATSPAAGVVVSRRQKLKGQAVAEGRGI